MPISDAEQLNSLGAISIKGMLLSLKNTAYKALSDEVFQVAGHFNNLFVVNPENPTGVQRFLPTTKTVVVHEIDLPEVLTVAGSSVVILDGNINHSRDVQKLLVQMRSAMRRSDRLVAVLYNPYYKLAFQLMNWLGLRRGPLPETFISRTILRGLAGLSGFEVTRVQPVLQMPFRLWGWGTWLGRLLRLCPGLRWAGFATVAVLRPIEKESKKPSLSIVVPARNEEGNIPHVISGLQNLEDVPLEVIFVEGHSRDRTWQKIQDSIRAYPGPIKLSAIQQTGIGKKNAVEEGLKIASGEVLTILDADLTMPASMLRRFYEAFCEGKGDFINGSRLVYPMEQGAMQFLNHLANVFFAKALSFVTDLPLSDSLCGTKLFSREHYDCMKKWNDAFGEFDPFGDFELIFSAAALGLGSVDIPIRYRARQYGTTNISRFLHGWQLLRMTALGCFTIKMGRSR